MLLLNRRGHAFESETALIKLLDDFVERFLAEVCDRHQIIDALFE